MRLNCSSQLWRNRSDVFVDRCLDATDVVDAEVDAAAEAAFRSLDTISTIEFKAAALKSMLINVISQYSSFHQFREAKKHSAQTPFKKQKLQLVHEKHSLSLLWLAVLLGGTLYLRGNRIIQLSVVAAFKMGPFASKQHQWQLEPLFLNGYPIHVEPMPI